MNENELVESQESDISIWNSIITKISPDVDEIIKQAESFVEENEGRSVDCIASDYADIIVREYTAVGAASALPSIIPGLGTAAQLAVEVGAISADLLLMIKFMSKMVYGLSVIYNKPRQSITIESTIMVLGVWCGILSPMKEAAARVAAKVVINVFNRKVPGEIFKKINRKVGVTILTKYGTKRGGVAVGKLIPFGVGALVGGGFNYATMKGFKKAAIKALSHKDYVFVEV